jgi:hypothetical protein
MNTYVKPVTSSVVTSLDSCGTQPWGLYASNIGFTSGNNYAVSPFRTSRGFVGVHYVYGTSTPWEGSLDYDWYPYDCLDELTSNDLLNPTILYQPNPRNDQYNPIDIKKLWRPRADLRKGRCRGGPFYPLYPNNSYLADYQYGAARLTGGFPIDSVQHCFNYNQNLTGIDPPFLNGVLYPYSYPYGTDSAYFNGVSYAAYKWNGLQWPTSSDEPICTVNSTNRQGFLDNDNTMFH